MSEGILSKPTDLVLSKDKPNLSTRTSPGPSEIERELIKRMEGQNFQNASDNCQNLQQKLIDQKRAEIEMRNKSEEQSRKKKIQLPKITNTASTNSDWELWGTALHDWKDFTKKNGKKVLPMVIRGIPPPLRPMAWQQISHADTRLHQKYSELLRQESNVEKLIARDVQRTFPEEELFQGDNGGTEMLFNVMKAYAVCDPEVGYCQGSAFLAGMLLLHMPEEDAFSVFMKLMSKGSGYGLRDMYKPGMSELEILLYQMDQLIAEHSPELANHFNAQGFATSTFASRWFLTLFSAVFPKQLSVRVLDIFFVDGLKVVFRCGLALLLTMKEQFLARDLEGMLRLAEKEAPKFFAKDPDLLIQKAYKLVTISDSKMTKWRKECESERKRQLAEEGEARRLRAENRILQGRIQSLEKENNTLAHSLIQKSVKQAIEAEEKLLLGKELKLAKKHVKRLSGGSVTESDTYQNGQPAGRYTEEFVLELQQELVKARLREAEATVQLNEAHERIQQVEFENRELLKGHKIEDAMHEASMAKKLEAEAVQALKELQCGLQANLNSDSISSESAMDSMISSAARAKSELIESKQQINVLEAHSRRFASERESLYSQIEVLKERLGNLQKEHERQGDDLLREQTLRKSELAKLKIDNLESKLDQAEDISSQMNIPDKLELLPDNLEAENRLGSDSENDDIEKFKLNLNT